MDENKPPLRLVYMHFSPYISEKGEIDNEKEWLQITAINDIGKVDKPVTQKIIKLNRAQQMELHTMLYYKFNREGLK